MIFGSISAITYAAKRRAKYRGKLRRDSDVEIENLQKEDCKKTGPLTMTSTNTELEIEDRDIK